MTIDLKVSGGAKVATALAVFALAFAPAAHAQTCGSGGTFGTGTFFEVAESINCNPGGNADPLADPFCANEVSRGFGTRIADATLTGSVESSVSTQFNGSATIEASSIINQRDWTGPAHGRITLDNGTRVVFSGQLNLALLQMQKAPVGGISGHWTGTKGTLDAGGEFTGTFFAPVACPAGTGLEGFCYIRFDSNGNPIGVEPATTAPNGMPLVKFEITFCN
jgi:hypothetical protein